MWMVLLFLLKGLTELSEASGPAISFAGRFSHEVNLRSRHEALHILYLFFIFFIFSVYSGISCMLSVCLHLFYIVRYIGLKLFPISPCPLNAHIVLSDISFHFDIANFYFFP